MWIGVLSGGCGLSSSQPDSPTVVIPQTMEKAQIPGLAALVIKKGVIQNEYYYGLANIEENRPVDANTLFMLASISKPVTAAAIVLLAERGLLNLDTSASAYLPFDLRHPDFPNAEITVRMLLAHTSSLRDNWDVLDPLYTIDSGGGDSPIGLLELGQNYWVPAGTWYSETENFAPKIPGSHHEYANMNYALLGLIVETIDGRLYSQFSREEVLEPLGMYSSGWLLSEVDPSHLAMPYEIVNRADPIAIGQYGYASYPDGQLRSTPREYAQFLHLFFESGLLSDDSLADFMNVQFPSVHSHQAIAWNYDEFESVFVRRYLGYLPAHTGGDPGVATIVVMDPEQKSAVIVFMNGSASNFRALTSVYIDLLHSLCSEAGIGR